jgi:uncharacterized membrane protein YccF (DUF307 family)
MDIHMTQVNLAVYGKGVYHMAVRIYNALPNTLKVISKDMKKFKNYLKNFCSLILFILWMIFLGDHYIIIYLSQVTKSIVQNGIFLSCKYNYYILTLPID